MHRLTKTNKQMVTLIPVKLHKMSIPQGELQTTQISLKFLFLPVNFVISIWLGPTKKYK